MTGDGQRATNVAHQMKLSGRNLHAAVLADVTPTYAMEHEVRTLAKTLVKMDPRNARWLAYGIAMAFSELDEKPTDLPDFVTVAVLRNDADLTRDAAGWIAENFGGTLETFAQRLVTW